MNASHDGDIEIIYPAGPVAGFRGESKGLKGTGTFSFEVLAIDENGKVLVRLSDLSFKTESKADKTYREMVGENEAPAGLDDADEDDGTDVA